MTNADLIAEARLVVANPNDYYVTDELVLLLADALEAVEAREERLKHEVDKGEKSDVYNYLRAERYRRSLERVVSGQRRNESTAIALLRLQGEAREALAETIGTTEGTK